MFKVSGWFIFKFIFTCGFICFLQNQIRAQISWQQEFYNYYYKDCGYNNESYQIFLKAKSLTGSAADFESLSYGIDALNHAFQYNRNNQFLDDAILLIQNVLNKAQESNRISNNKFGLQSNHKSWIDNNSGTYMQGNESQLYEGKFFKSVCPLLYFIKKDNKLRLNARVQKFADSVIRFIEREVWNKWYKRSFHEKDSCGVYLLDGRTHMASHWATIAQYMYKLVPKSIHKKEYTWLINTYNKKLRNNLRKHPLNSNAWIWNSTWDDGWKVGAGCTAISEKAEVQDFNHANEVISYMIKSNRLKIHWTKNDLKKIINTTKLLWIRNKNGFCGFLDADTTKQPSYFIAEGFAKLGCYNTGIDSLMIEIAKNTSLRNYSRQGCQLLAVLLYNKKFYQNINLK